MPLLVMKLQKLRSILWNKFHDNKQWEHFSEKGENYYGWQNGEI